MAWAWWTMDMSDFHKIEWADTPFGIADYNESSYGDTFADVYDDWYSTLNDTDFITAIVATLPNMPVRILELGVGTGRLITQILQQRSPICDDLIGVDSSDAMLQIAHQQNFPKQVELYLADFSSSLPDGLFDVIFVGYNTLFNLPDTEALRSCLTLIAQHLSKDGVFYLDAVMPLSDEVGDNVTEQIMATNEVVLSVSSHDAETQRIIGQFVQFGPDSTIRLRPWSVRYWTPDQLDEVAQSCGLQLQSRCADGKGTTFTESSSRHVSQYKRMS